MSAEAPAPEAAAPHKPSKLPLILAIAGLLLGLAGAGGAVFAWKVASAARAEADEDKPAKGKDAKDGKDAKGEKKDKDGKDKKEKERKPAVFLPAETFTVNLQKGPGRDHFLQVGIVLEMADAHAADAVKAQLPLIRSQLLLLLAARTAEELATPEGKDKLAAELLERVKKPLEGAPENAGVERVHYSAFIIQ